MYQEKKAIVLKSFSQHKYAILDSTQGRLDVITIKPVPIGALISYQIDKERGTLIYITELNIINMPLVLAREDILFLHHIFELCFFFVPLGIYMPELFELCMFWYTVDSDSCRQPSVKKFFLFKLFMMFGMYSRLPDLSKSTLHILETLPMHKLTSVHFEDYQTSILNKWLQMCVADHPAISHFKTVHFLST